MRFIFMIFTLTFLLMQAAQAGRYYHSDYGRFRFVSRDPIGYVDGMSLYNAYFAEGFNVDPSGLEITIVAPDTKGLTPDKEKKVKDYNKVINDYINDVIAKKEGSPEFQEILKCLKADKKIDIKIRQEKVSNFGQTKVADYKSKGEFIIRVNRGVAIVPSLRDVRNILAHEFLHVLVEIYKHKDKKPCDCVNNKSFQAIVDEYNKLLSSIKGKNLKFTFDHNGLDTDAKKPDTGSVDTVGNIIGDTLIRKDK